jgi:hypothetical protein
MKVWYRVEIKALSNVFEGGGTSNYRGSYIMTFSNGGAEPTLNNVRKVRVYASTGFGLMLPKFVFVLTISFCL